MTRSPAVVILGVILGALVGCGTDEAPSPSADPSPTATAPASQVPTEAPPVTTGPPLAGPDAGLRDRIYEVGKDIKPGVYVTTVPADHPHPCYWARLRSFGQSGAIIDEGNPGPGEEVRVTVLPADKGFKVANGCAWTAAAPL